jgi:plasmid replication initiation protein
MEDKNEKKVIWQDNFITSGRYEMTALEKNILYAVLSQLKKTDPIGHVYLVSTKDITGLNGDRINFENFRKSTEKLLTRVIEGILPNGNLLQVNFISHAEYLKNQGVISIGLSPKVVPFFMDLKKNFTTFDLDIALSLKSIYSKRFYEILSRYKNLPDKTFSLKLDHLKSMLEIINPQSGKDKYPTYTLFKKNVLDLAYNEINKLSDLNFSYTPIEGTKHGKGRKSIDSIHFEVKNLARKKFISYDIEESKPAFNRLMKEFCLRQDQATQIMNMYELPEIHKKMYDLNLLILNGKVHNVGAYTVSYFNLPSKQK